MNTWIYEQDPRQKDVKSNKRQISTRWQESSLAHTSPANETSDCSNLTFSSMSSNFFS